MCDKQYYNDRDDLVYRSRSPGEGREMKIVMQKFSFPCELYHTVISFKIISSIVLQYTHKKMNLFFNIIKSPSSTPKPAVMILSHSDLCYCCNDMTFLYFILSCTSINMNVMIWHKPQPAHVSSFMCPAKFMHIA